MSEPSSPATTRVIWRCRWKRRVCYVREVMAFDARRIACTHFSRLGIEASEQGLVCELYTGRKRKCVNDG